MKFPCRFPLSHLSQSLKSLGSCPTNKESQLVLSHTQRTSLTLIDLLLRKQRNLLLGQRSGQGRESVALLDTQTRVGAAGAIYLVPPSECRLC